MLPKVALPESKLHFQCNEFRRVRYRRADCGHGLGRQHGRVALGSGLRRQADSGCGPWTRSDQPATRRYLRLQSSP
jgi:hypothetical protein